MMPDTRPAKGSTPDALAIPRHSGSATRKTTTPVIRSRGSVESDARRFMMDGKEECDLERFIVVDQPAFLCCVSCWVLPAE